MAVITSSVISYQGLRPDGRSDVAETHTDSTGRTHLVNYISGVSDNLQTNLAAHATVLTAQLPADEINAWISHFLSALDNPTAYTFNFATQQQFYQAFVRAVMAGADVRIVLALKPVITWLQATYTAAQIAAYLNMTTAVVNSISARCTAIFNIGGTLNADAPIVGI